jgi:predicted nucleic acid-binding protein
MTTSKKVYIASDLLISFIDRTNPRQGQAGAYFRYFAQEGYSLYTDIITLYDVHEQMSRTMSPSVAKDFMRTIYISSLSIIHPENSDMKAALKIHLNDRSNELTFRQALMMILADRKKIPQIATFEYIHSMFGLSIFFIPI